MSFAENYVSCFRLRLHRKLCSMWFWSSCLLLFVINLSNTVDFAWANDAFPFFILAITQFHSFQFHLPEIFKNLAGEIDEITWIFFRCCLSFYIFSRECDVIAEVIMAPRKSYTTSFKLAVIVFWPALKTKSIARPQLLYCIICRWWRLVSLYLNLTLKIYFLFKYNLYISTFITFYNILFV